MIFIKYWDDSEFLPPQIYNTTKPKMTLLSITLMPMNKWCVIIFNSLLFSWICLKKNWLVKERPERLSLVFS